MSNPQASPLLALPTELRLQIYRHVLVLPAYKRTHTRRHTGEVHAALLGTCHQIHREALPILYGENTFLAHQSLLADFPSLRDWHPPVRTARLLPHIRRWHVRVRLDCDAPYDAAAVARAFSGADELTVEVRQAVFRGVGRAVLRLFEGVRGVKAARVVGSTTGFEAYGLWLERAMCSPRGSEVVPFT